MPVRECENRQSDQDLVSAGGFAALVLLDGWGEAATGQAVLRTDRLRGVELPPGFV